MCCFRIFSLFGYNLGIFFEDIIDRKEKGEMNKLNFSVRAKPGFGSILKQDTAYKQYCGSGSDVSDPGSPTYISESLVTIFRVKISWIRNTLLSFLPCCCVQLGADVQDIRRVTIWGNHSSTQYPDIAHATVKGAPVSLDEEWVQAVFVPTVQKRGAAVIAARKLSSAMSAAKVPYHNKDLGRRKSRTISSSVRDIFWASAILIR
jgi:hypothetical protein